VQLLTELFERHASARQRGAAPEPQAWLDAWGGATRAATALVATEAERRLREAGLVSRCPKRMIAAMLPTREDREVIAARLSAAGTELEFAAESSGDDLRRLSGELERAWDRLTEAAGRELSSWDQRAVVIRSWRRPWSPLVLGSVAAALLALWAGLVLGGYLPVPSLLRPVAEWYWSLPWP
jgi:hypothetical protein